MEPYLLISAAGLQDPRFRRSIVFIWEHNSSGAQGVIVNQPSTNRVSEFLPGWDSALVDPKVVFVGGPVEPEMAIALGPSDRGAELIGAGIGLIDLGSNGSQFNKTVRFFAGYSGWGPGQLDAELADGAWLIAPASTEDLFSTDPDHLWDQAVSRLNDQPQFLKTMPTSPSSN